MKPTHSSNQPDEYLRRARAADRLPVARPTAQTDQALTALAHATPDSRSSIEAAARDYLAQLNRRSQHDSYSRTTAYLASRGSCFTRLLGIDCRPDDALLPATARAVLDALDAPVRRLTMVAIISGHPAVVAMAHLAGALCTEPMLPVVTR